MRFVIQRKIAFGSAQQFCNNIIQKYFSISIEVLTNRTIPFTIEEVNLGRKSYHAVVATISRLLAVLCLPHDLFAIQNTVNVYQTIARRDSCGKVPIVSCNNHAR